MTIVIIIPFDRWSVSSKPKMQPPIERIHQRFRQGCQHRIPDRVTVLRILNVLSRPSGFAMMPKILRLLAYSTFSVSAEGLVQAVEGALRSVSKTPKRNCSLYLYPVLTTEEEFVVI